MSDQFSPNQYGYINSKSPRIQLVQVLGIEKSPQASSVLTRRIRDLVEEHLKIQHQPKEQTKAIRAIWKQILREYPDLFSQRNSKERKRRLYFVLRFVCYVHNARRSQNRTLKNQKRKKVQALTAFIDKLETGDTREEPIELLDSDSEVSASDDLLPEECGQTVTIENFDAAVKTKSEQKSRLKQTPVFRHPSSRAAIEPSVSYKAMSTYFKIANQQLEGVDKSQDATSLISGPVRPGNMSAAHGCTIPNRDMTCPTRPGTESSGMQKAIEPSSNPRMCYSNDERSLMPTDAVRKFLSTCQPSMHFLADDFIKYGCATEAHLRKLAGFSQEKRMLVLRNILAGRFMRDSRKCNDDDGKLNKMDIEILDDELASYRYLTRSRKLLHT